MNMLMEPDELRYAYRKKARLQKYKNINSQMAFRNKHYKSASPPEWKLPVVTSWNTTELATWNSRVERKTNVWKNL